MYFFVNGPYKYITLFFVGKLVHVGIFVMTLHMTVDLFKINIIIRHAN